jgi:hypothetical protein
MEISGALKIIRGLADGVNPVTGELLDDRSPYHDAMIVRALYTVIQVVEDVKPQIDLSDSQSGKPWLTSEDERLCNEFHDAIDFREIARMHGRTRGAIFSRLVKLGQIKRNGSASGQRRT